MTFVRYFVISGLDAAAGLELEEATMGGSGGDKRILPSVSDEFNPLERAYKPKILRIFPDVGGWSHFNPDALHRLILPQGLRFCTNKEVENYAPKCHSFSLTNENGEKSCGVALIFYEEVTDINICHALHTLQKMYFTEAESGNTLKRTDRLRPRSAKVSSERSRSLPRHYQQAKLSTSTLDLSSATYDYRKDTLYVNKGIAVICAQPMVQIASQVLLSMQKYISRSDFDIQVLEGLIYNILHDIPIPSPGRSIRFWCLGEALTLSMPKTPLELPLYDYNLLEFFDILGIDNAIKLFTCTLLENQILVYSSDFEKLMLVCESVTSLMYPFAWQHVYVPILPPNLENFLDAPVPYIMGLLRRTHDRELSLKGSVCIVDIDSGELDLPEELPKFPHEEELIAEIQNNVVRFGGKDGADILREHAIESRDILEMSTHQNNNDNNSDTMEQLNQMISRFEALSANAKPVRNNSSDRLRLNNALREIFVNRFVNMFLSFEHFVIVASETELSLTPQQQETLQNFDKISFLSDQKQSHLPFLSSFLETQTFSTFIDDYIMGTESANSQYTPFIVRLNELKERFGESLVRTPTYECCDRIDLSDEILMRRLKKVEMTVTPQKTDRVLRGVVPKNVTPGVFPLLDPSRFVSSKSKADNTAIFVKGGHQSKSIDPSILPKQKISLLNASPAAIAETNWKFVQELLKECKAKTKRILLEKLGQEAAVQWGHGSIGFTGTEENMLVASVCDLIERIFSHGLVNRSGKSSLWHFLYKFGRAHEKILKFKGTLGTQALCVPIIRSKPFVLPDHSRNIQILMMPKRRTMVPDPVVLAAIHNVLTIREIKTEIGYARAWVRLALERKSLSQFLHILVSDPVLLKNLYKRYAFLRCEDEREQALYHLQTLTTVEFSCFTNAYTNSSLLYQVLIFPSSKSGSAPCSSNIWLHVIGSSAESSIVHIPKGVIHFSMWEKNLGVITSLRLGHDNSGSSPNWLVEHVLIRNEFTGQTFKFACGRWLGHSMDDGSTERYMVGYSVPADCDVNKLVQVCASPPEHTFPTMPIKSVDPVNEIVELQTMLGDAINRIVKFYHKSLNEKISYAHLMCGEYGLVHALVNIFSFGFKSARLFGKNLSVWDFFLKVTMDFNQSLAHLQMPPGSPLNSPRRMGGSYTLDSPKRNSSLSNLLDSPRREPTALGSATASSLASAGQTSTTPQGTLSRSNQFRRMYTRLITKIETSCGRLGKDDKFQLFICLSAHDRLLGRILTDLTRSVAAQHLYEENSFLRKPNLISFLSHILEAIQDITIPVDPAMTKSLDQYG